MPKKGKKGGKGKGKKGKKGKKSSKKAESAVATATASAAVWETRLTMVEQSRHEYRENARKLMTENDDLQKNMHNIEKDTIDVITLLKKQDQIKDDQIDTLHRQLKELKKEHRKEKERIVEDCNDQINQLEERLNAKANEVHVMQTELKMVKEFRRKRAQMTKELDEIKDSMFIANKDHKATLTRMEQKFFEEKMRLQQEANQKIAELAEKAHTEAIANLDETTRSVYKENVRITESLGYHMRDGDKLKNEKNRLKSENEDLREDKELKDVMVKEKVIETKKQKELIKELYEKIATLEQSLSHVVREFEHEKQDQIDRARIENESSKIEIAKLQRIVELKTKEMNKVKRLAKNILDERTEMERFFLESLDQVKVEIAANQLQYKKDAQIAYIQKMLVAHSGQGSYPKIRTFNKSETSTNNVFQDLEAAQTLMGAANKVDISDLTWEQKERVLRYLFAKMNGVKNKHRPNSLPAIKHNRMLSIEEKENRHNQEVVVSGDGGSTFLTQSQGDDVNVKLRALPDIDPTKTEQIVT